MAASCLNVRNICLSQSRSYVKALKRKAIRVLSQEEATHMKSNHPKSKIGHSAEHDSGRGSASDLKVKSPISTGFIGISNNSVQDVGNYQFEMLRPGDMRFGPVVTDAKSLPVRQVKGLILLEGKRLVREAVSTGQELKSIFFTRNESLDGLPMQELVNSGVKVYKVKANHMQLWSDTATPQGLMAICKIPKTNAEKSAALKTIPVCLICDGILDPGVLGTLLRSAIAAGCSKILVTQGCVDAWEPKVLRSAAGNHFRAASLVTGVSWNSVNNYLSSGIQLFLVSTPPRKQNTSTAPPPPPASSEAAETDRCRSSKQSEVFADLPVVSLNDVRCSSGGGGDEVVVIATELPGKEAVKVVSERGGFRLKLPGEEVLLSCAASGSIALFEFARQFRSSSLETIPMDDQTNGARRRTDSETDSESKKL